MKTDISRTVERQLWKLPSLFPLLQDSTHHLNNMLNCDWSQENFGISLKLLNIWLCDLLAQILYLQLGKAGQQIKISFVILDLDKSTKNTESH